MKLKKLQLENFRNYPVYKQKFNSKKNITIFIGENGAGKTNLLEAIYVLSIGKSFRTNTKEELISWEKDFFRCSGEIQIENDDISLEVFSSPNKKNFKKNGVNLINNQYIGEFLTVLFHPEDLNILYLAPSLRRKYLDILLSQTDKKYLEALINYKKILKQRNALLSNMQNQFFKQEKSFDEFNKDLEVWNQNLVDYGDFLIKKRLNFIEFAGKILTNLYNSISDNKNNISVKYKSTVSGDYDKNLFYKELNNKNKRDIIYGATTIGPHRDDLLFFIDEKEFSSTASRGEFRTLLIALKLAEIEFIQEKTGEKPVLLLDDVFSELDIKRQNKLISILESYQTIITATDLEKIENIFIKKHNIEVVNI